MLAADIPQARTVTTNVETAVTKAKKYAISVCLVNLPWLVVWFIDVGLCQILRCQFFHSTILVC